MASLLSVDPGTPVCLSVGFCGSVEAMMLCFWCVV